MTDDPCERMKDAIVEVCGNPRPGESNTPDELVIRGLEAPAARETLRETINSQQLSGEGFRFSFGCRQLWRDVTDLPVYDRELDQDGVEMVFAEVCAKPLTWIRIQSAASAAWGGSSDAETFLREPLMRAEALSEMVDILESGRRELPKPVLELDSQGRIRPFQEGRTRGVAAFYAEGVDMMPFLVMLNPGKDDGADEVTIPFEFDLRGVLESRRPESLD